jgi:hypothetical protein
MLYIAKETYTKLSRMCSILVFFIKHALYTTQLSHICEPDLDMACPTLESLLWWWLILNAPATDRSTDVGGLDFFDMSLFDVYNVPMLMVPQGGSGDSCTSTGCVEDSLGMCPLELKITSMDGKENVSSVQKCLWVIWISDVLLQRCLWFSFRKRNSITLAVIVIRDVDIYIYIYIYKVLYGLTSL